MGKSEEAEEGLRCRRAGDSHREMTERGRSECEGRINHKLNSGFGV